jgi:hypothetical protein
VSNRLYGLHLGIGNEWYLGYGFAVSLDVHGALFWNVVKERAKYETADKYNGPASKVSRTDWTLVPQFQGQLNVWWYPIEGVIVNAGYDLMAFFNTVASNNPVDFNYAYPNPEWDREARWFDGFRIGVGVFF